VVAVSLVVARRHAYRTVAELSHASGPFIVASSSRAAGFGKPRRHLVQIFLTREIKVKYSD